LRAISAPRADQVEEVSSAEALASGSRRQREESRSSKCVAIYAIACSTNAFLRLMFACEYNMPLRMAAFFKEKSVLVVEAIAQLRVDLPRIVEMKPTERIAVVDEQMAIRDVKCIDGSRETFSKRFA
jgi:hypothetical protein